MMQYINNDNINIDKLAEGKRIFDIEIEALSKTRDSLNDTFVKILDIITSCKGKVIITGMGKPGHIAAKMAATFSSLGTPSFKLHPADAMHGDLGMISCEDVVIAISYSGESDEIVKIIPNIKMIGATLIGITGNPKSTLAEAAQITQVLPSFQEACILGLAPTSSTTVALCYGDALAVCASKIYGFNDEDFGKYHPAGSLGKKIILRVEDLMAKNDDVPLVQEGTLLMDAIAVMTSKGLGVVSISNSSGVLTGIITDGDLRRIIERRIDFYTSKVEEVMVKSPKKIYKNILAVDALQYIKQAKINNLPVIDSENKVIGTITLQILARAGILI